MSTEGMPGAKKKSLFGGLNVTWILAIAVALMASFGALAIFGQAAETTTYYVLNQDVPARTQINRDMLSPVITAVGGEPPNAIGRGTVGAGEMFSLMPLKEGDVLSFSNVGPLQRINDALPDNFVVASFAVAPENAAAGKIRRGDYIDIVAISPAAGNNPLGKTAKIVLQHVLVLDVMVSPKNIGDAAQENEAGEVLDPGPESLQARSGIPEMYAVALSPQDAARLALARDQNPYVLLSANVTPATLDVQAQLGDLFNPGGVNDSGAGTEAARNGETPADTEPGTGTDTGTATESPSPSESIPALPPIPTNDPTEEPTDGEITNGEFPDGENTGDATDGENTDGFTEEPTSTTGG